MVMESTRRPFDRTLSKEPGLKKPRLAEDPAASDRNLNARDGFLQRQLPSNSSIGTRAQRAGNLESGDSLRGASQLQQGQLLHQELINQYKSALSELTFNSKPIITNLTIIAGENLHAAKAIAATVYANILEVPKDQKLPSLYLLDSIVKNIGQDYIKHFAPRLPEVFCKTYRQVDPSIHQGMHHLFGTWKGVFPPQPLHMIEKELDFIATANGSSSAASTLRADSLVQRPAGPAHSIHVNPKYLESRQRIPDTSPRGSNGEINGTLASSYDDVETPGRTASAKNYHRIQINELVPAREKRSSMVLLDSEYGSSMSGRSGSITGRVGEKFKEQELDRPWYDSGSDIDIEKLSSQKNDVRMKHRTRNYVVGPSVSSDSHLEMRKNFTSNSVSRSWRNSDEEEYMWDDVKGRPTGHDADQLAGSSFKDSWTPANFEKTDFDRYQKRPQSLNYDRPSMDDEASGPLSWTEDLDPLDGRMLLAPGKNVGHSSEGYLSGSKGYLNATDRALQPQFRRGPTEGQNHSDPRNVMSGHKVSVTRQRQMHGAALSSAVQHRPRSPSVSVQNPNELLNKSVGRNRTSIRAPTDPRRPPEQRNSGSPDQFSQDSMPSVSGDVHQSNARRLNPPKLQASSAGMPLQQRNHVTSSRLRKLEVASLESSGGGKNSSRQALASDRTLIGSSSSERSIPLAVDSPGQSINSNLTAGMKGSLLCRASPKLGSPEVGHKLSTDDPLRASVLPSLHMHENVHLEYPEKEGNQRISPPANDPSDLPGLGAEEAPTTVSSTSNLFANLFSSLMEKGLISGSKSDALSSSSTQKAAQEICGDGVVSSTIASPDSSVHVSRDDPLISVTNKTDPQFAAKSPNDLSVLKDEIKNLIGFEFRPDAVRNLNPDVIADLFADVPYQCDTCGIRLKVQHSLAQHMEWHALRQQNQLNGNSRMWYASLFNWMDQNCDIDASESTSDLVGDSIVELESIGQMVTADESQLACMLCGNLFEDFYCREKNEWIFREAVHLNIPIINSCDQSENASGFDSLGPIVHANCILEDFIQDFGLESDVKREKDM